MSPPWLLLSSTKGKSKSAPCAPCRPALAALPFPLPLPQASSFGGLWAICLVYSPKEHGKIGWPPQLPDLWGLEAPSN